MYLYWRATANRRAVREDTSESQEAPLVELPGAAGERGRRLSPRGLLDRLLHNAHEVDCRILTGICGLCCGV